MQSFIHMLIRPRRTQILDDEQSAHQQKPCLRWVSKGRQPSTEFPEKDLGDLFRFRWPLKCDTQAPSPPRRSKTSFCLLIGFRSTNALRSYSFFQAEVLHIILARQLLPHLFARHLQVHAYMIGFMSRDQGAGVRSTPRILLTTRQWLSSALGALG